MWGDHTEFENSKWLLTIDLYNKTNASMRFYCVMYISVLYNRAVQSMASLILDSQPPVCLLKTTSKPIHRTRRPCLCPAIQAVDVVAVYPLPSQPSLQVSRSNAKGLMPCITQCICYNIEGWTFQLLPTGIRTDAPLDSWGASVLGGVCPGGHMSGGGHLSSNPPNQSPSTSIYKQWKESSYGTPCGV